MKLLREPLVHFLALGLGLFLLFGQQTHGDHRIAAFDWPFDSVRGYYLNLSALRWSGVRLG